MQLEKNEKHTLLLGIQPCKLIVEFMEMSGKDSINFDQQIEKL